MLCHSSDASYLLSVTDVEGLHFSEVVNWPHFDDTLGICCDEAVERRQCVDSHERLLMARKLTDGLLHIGVPNEHFEVEPATNDDLMLFTVRNFSNSPLVARKLLFGDLCKIRLKFCTDLFYTEVLFDLFFLRVNFCIFGGSFLALGGLLLVVRCHLFIFVGFGVL